MSAKTKIFKIENINTFGRINNNEFGRNLVSEIGQIIHLDELIQQTGIC